MGLENLKSAFSNIGTFNQSDLTQMSSVDSIIEEPQEVDYMGNSKASGFSANQYYMSPSLFTGVVGESPDMTFTNNSLYGEGVFIGEHTNLFDTLTNYTDYPDNSGNYSIYELATDTSNDIDFVKHAMDWFSKNEGYIPEYWVILRPTTPLREPEVINNAIKKIIDNTEATSLISIHEFAETPGKMFGMLDGFLHGLCPMDPRPEYFTLPRQEFAPSYFGNGYVDIVKSSTIIKSNSCFGSRMLGFEAPDTGEIDIPEDFKRVEFYLSTTNNSIYQKLLTLNS